MALVVIAVEEVATVAEVVTVAEAAIVAVVIVPVDMTMLKSQQLLPLRLDHHTPAVVAEAAVAIVIQLLVQVVGNQVAGHRLQPVVVGTKT